MVTFKFDYFHQINFKCVFLVEVFTSLKHDTFGRWIWESDNSVANSQLIEHNFYITPFFCASAYIAYNNGTNGHVVYTYGLQPQDCNSKAVPMCFVSRSL